MTGPENTHENLTSTAAWGQVEAQGRLKPGEAGWWEVWGATVHDARPGDLILAKVDGEILPTLVIDLFPAKADPVRVGIVTDHGERVTFGALNRIVLLRPGTKHTLA